MLTNNIVLVGGDVNTRHPLILCHHPLEVVTKLEKNYIFTLILHKKLFKKENSLVYSLHARRASR